MAGTVGPPRKLLSDTAPVLAGNEHQQRSDAVAGAVGDERAEVGLPENSTSEELFPVAEAYDDRQTRVPGQPPGWQRPPLT
jgi:hypothetical protein